MKTRTKDESKVSGKTRPRHFQCKKCRFDGLENETNNSRRFAAVHESAFGTKQTYRGELTMSAFGGKADIVPKCRFVRL